MIFQSKCALLVSKISEFSSSLALKTFLLTIFLWILVVVYVAFYSFGMDYRSGSSNCQALVGTVRTLRKQLDEGSIKMENVLEQLKSQLVIVFYEVKLLVVF